ncbi:MAG: class I SAM-dependent methyltransferase [Chlamydiia bacterium]
MRFFPLFVTCGLLSIAPQLSANRSGLSLIDRGYIADYLTHEAAWAESHGAHNDDLGAGMLYYALAYMRKAQLCVCLGSGGGFVPRIMKQAQRDLGLHSARTILVDANIGGYGRPKWLAPDHFFRTEYPDVEIIMDLTQNVALSHPEWQIDYLHIDADHSFEGAYHDFWSYLPLMSRRGIITFHDTGSDQPCAKMIAHLQKQGFEIVNFRELGAGVAIIYPSSKLR